MNPNTARTMRAKFQVAGVEQVEHDGTVTAEKVRFHAVAKSGAYPADGSDEDNTFAKFTPQADCSITIANPALFGEFALGQKFHVDFTRAEAPAVAVTAAAEQPGEATTPQNPMAESIRGYRQFDAGTANYINAVKETGDVVAQMLQDARDLGADPRALALAQTKFQEAAMWLIRSVAKPEGLF